MGELGHVGKKDAGNYKNPYILYPEDYKNQEDLFTALFNWWKKRRKAENTITRRTSAARRISNHPVKPINWLKLTPESAIGYLEYREYEENATPWSVINDWKVISMIAKAFGVDAKAWGYVPPKPPKRKLLIIPEPVEVYKMIHQKYSKDKYTNALIQYILMHGFLIGWRPSEIAIQKISDVHPDRGYLIIEEPKKDGQKRQVFLDENAMLSSRRKSMKNWIKQWRPKVANGLSGDFLYIQPNGKPFTVPYLRKFIARYVKPLCPDFHLYKMRHWCATAYLIKSKIETKRWDIWDVQKRLGHDKLATTQGYVDHAINYMGRAPYDWIRAILKFHFEVDQKNSLKSKRGKKTSVSNGTNRSSKRRTWRDSNPRSIA